jgi:hypothetical protein
VFIQRCSSVAPVRDALFLNAESVDTKAHRVAGLQESRRLHAKANTRGRSGRDDVARFQQHVLAGFSDDTCDREDHVARIRALHSLAVDLEP